jgi:phosphate transport system substrate-binding protein
MKLSKKLSVALAVSALFSSLAFADVKTIAVDGSSTVYPITEAVAEDFQKKTGTKVTVGISGTGGGFKKFCRGETVISNASRPILKKEMDACAENGITYIELPIAYDALTIVANKGNDWAKQITVEELNTIWKSGSSAKTWKDVNSSYPAQPLKLFGPGSDSGPNSLSGCAGYELFTSFGPGSDSGTFDYFTEAINGRAKSSRSDYTSSEDDNVLVTGVAGDKGGLGYFGLAYYEENKDKLRALPVVAKGSTKAVLPSVEAVKDGSYQPLSRPLFIYVNATKGAFNKDVKAFVEYYLANAPVLVKEVKYVPLPTNEYTAVTAHWKELKAGTGFGGVPEVGVKIEDLLKRVK